MSVNACESHFLVLQHSNVINMHVRLRYTFPDRYKRAGENYIELEYTEPVEKFLDISGPSPPVSRPSYLSLKNPGQKYW
jgi:hypothetical protein